MEADRLTRYRKKSLPAGICRKASCGLRITGYIGYSPVSDFRRPASKIFLADNEYAVNASGNSIRQIIRKGAGLPGRGGFDVWHLRHLPTGTDQNRRVAKARHRDGCNVAFMDGGSGWVQGEKMTPQMWDPK